ncbi:MAG: peptidase [Leptothrix sp. (in: Bacteria)]|nr:peptidase [Leptothrix sp. (in: b-proteobacteria)]
MNSTTLVAFSKGRALHGAALGLLVALLAACSSPTHRAPVEERRPTVAPRPATPAVAPAPLSASAVTPPAPLPSTDAAAKPPPGAENAGKPGYYTVKPGDTMIRVGLENGQNWRDIARWNGLDNPNVLEVGQVLRVVPPAPDPTAASARPVAAPGRIESRPLTGAGVPVAAGSSPAATAAASAASAPAATGDVEGEPNWLWPAAGPVVTGFDDVKSKGLVITGTAGDPVYAAADGRIVYAGAGLRGYGNLVIVKHNSTYLTAYAHNQALLVKEDQVVRRGQKIAEMGSSDAERVQLHFEIRRQGKPVDPARLLPPR